MSDAEMRLTLISAKAAQLANDIAAGKLWPGDLERGLQEIREQLSKIKGNPMNAHDEAQAAHDPAQTLRALLPYVPLGAYLKAGTCYNDCMAAIAALTAQASAKPEQPPAGAQGGQWRSIETAPRGAKGYAWMLLAWGPEEDRSTGIGMHAEGRFFAAGTFFTHSGFPAFEFRQVEAHPTHWMPLPPAPSQSEAPTASRINQEAP